MGKSLLFCSNYAFLEFCVCRFTCIYIQLKEPHIPGKRFRKKNGQSNVSCIALNEKNNLIVYGQEVQIYFIIINFQNFSLKKKVA